MLRAASYVIRLKHTATHAPIKLVALHAKLATFWIRSRNVSVVWPTARPARMSTIARNAWKDIIILTKNVKDAWMTAYYVRTVPTANSADKATT